MMGSNPARVMYSTPCDQLLWCNAPSDRKYIHSVEDRTEWSGWNRAWYCSHNEIPRNGASNIRRFNLSQSGVPSSSSVRVHHFLPAVWKQRGGRIQVSVGSLADGWCIPTPCLLTWLTCRTFPYLHGLSQGISSATTCHRITTHLNIFPMS